MASISTLMSGEASAATCTSVLTGKSPRENLAARPPDFLAVLDVGDEDHDLDDVGHCAARRLDQAAHLDEDRLRLLVLVALDGLAVLAARHQAGDVGDAVHHQAVRPRAGRGSGAAGLVTRAMRDLLCAAMRLFSRRDLMSVAASCRKMARRASRCRRIDPGAGGKIIQLGSQAQPVCASELAGSIAGSRTPDNTDDQLATA